jgi:hypothetical protein
MEQPRLFAEKIVEIMKEKNIKLEDLALKKVIKQSRTTIESRNITKTKQKSQKPRQFELMSKEYSENKRI